MRYVLLGVVLLLARMARQSIVEPVVRIGLNENAATVTVRSTETFTVAGRVTRAATFAAVVAVDPDTKGPVAAADLQYRITVKFEDDTTVVMPADARVR